MFYIISEIIKARPKEEDKLMLTKVGKYLRMMRLNNDEILRDMASRLKVTSAFLSAVENGKKKMPKKMRENLIAEYMLSDDEVKALDAAILESNDSVEINLKTLSDAKKGLAISFARSFGELSDEDVAFFTEYLNKRNKEK